MYSPTEKCMSMLYILKDLRNEETYIVQIYLSFYFCFIRTL